jgi:hypothetical protein
MLQWRSSRALAAAFVMFGSRLRTSNWQHGKRGQPVEAWNYQIARLREERDALLISARTHLAAYRSLPASLASRVSRRMHLALARNRLFLARGLNRRIVSELRRKSASEPAPR